MVQKLVEDSEEGGTEKEQAGYKYSAMSFLTTEYSVDLGSLLSLC